MRGLGTSHKHGWFTFITLTFLLLFGVVSVGARDGKTTPTPTPFTTSLNYNLTPNFGTGALTGGFVPDPYSVAITSGGSVNLSSAVSGCTGFATPAPDFELTYTSRNASLLRFYFVADDGSDTTLIINDTVGDYYCTDDSFGTLNPTIDFANPTGGTYDVWVGSYTSGSYVSGTLYVTEVSTNHPLGVVATTTSVPSQTTTGLNFNLSPTYGSDSLTSGFVPDPYRVAITSGGSVNVSYIGTGCSGYATSAPDFSLSYVSGAFSTLRFYFAGTGDTTMVINSPTGAYTCADDSFGTFNPTIDFSNPTTGRYDIWIGSYTQGVNTTGTLYISENTSNHP